MATAIGKMQVEEETDVDCLFCEKSKRGPHTTPRKPHRGLVGKRSNAKYVIILLYRLILSYLCSTNHDPALIVLKKVKRTDTKTIGRGAYGRVFEVEYKSTRYAAKEIHTLLLESAKGGTLQCLKDKFLHECHMWGLLRHPRIVQVIGQLYNC